MSINDWKYDEFVQIGKDYSNPKESEIYDKSHSDFRDVKKENLDLIKKLKIKASHHVIEFGTGTGEFAIEASKVGAKIIAIDISDEMLKIAKKKNKEEKTTSLKFIKSGFLNFEAKANSFDFVVTSYAFHHLPDFWKSIALSRIFNMLKPKGIFYIQDVVIKESNCLENINSFIKHQEKQGGAFLKQDAIGHFKEEFSTFDWIFEKLLEKNGFEVMEKEYQFDLIGKYFCRKKTKV